MYNKSAKLEYSRYIIFENIEGNSEETKRCLEKVEKDVEKNVQTLQNLDKDFMICLEEYKQKKENLYKCQEENKKAKNLYEKILEETKNLYEKILEEDVNISKEFITSENKDRKKDLNNLLIENGINEKNSFDVDVISNAVNTTIEIYKKEIEIFLVAYERTKKLLSEIEENDVKIDKHKKLINDSNAKLHFLTAEKEYIVGFLDNERIAAIYDKKVHRKLMLEACRNFISDLSHINSLYDILLKEANSRSSKRLYKENYNRDYLLNIKKVSEGAEEEITKLKANAVAVMDLNYWRIDGITKIQETFEKDVKEIYGRDLEEIFPEEKSKILEKQNEDKIEIKEELDEEKIVKNFKCPSLKLKSPKKNLENVVNKLKDTNKEIPNASESLAEESDNYSSEDDALFEKISMLDELDEETNLDDISTEEKYIDKEDIEENDDEESIFDFCFKEYDVNEQKRRIRDEKKLNKDDEKINIFKKLIGVNSKSKKEA